MQINKKSTVFTRISAAVLFQFFAPQVRRFFETTNRNISVRRLIETSFDSHHLTLKAFYVMDEQ